MIKKTETVIYKQNFKKIEKKSAKEMVLTKYLETKFLK